MHLINLLRSGNLDLPYENDSVGIQALLEEKFEVYIKELAEFYESEYGNKSDDMTKEIKVTTEKINEIIRQYLRGDIPGAYNKMSEIMSHLEQSLEVLCEYYKKYTSSATYYRARVCDEEHNEYTKKEEFLHIAFENRGRVKNQRYSVCGFPCLYLGATPYTCYEELGRPEEENIYFVKIELPKDYKLIPIGILPYELKDFLVRAKDENNEKIIENYLKMLPLIMACSVRVGNGNKQNTFKEEYIIPQLVTQWLITSGTKFDGILYFSTATITHSKRNYRLYQNIMLPVREIANKGYCKKIVKDIKLTLPISAKGIEFFKEYSFDFFKGYDSLHELPGNGLVSINSEQSIHYSASGFRAIEAKLSEMECSVINSI